MTTESSCSELSTVFTISSYHTDLFYHILRELSILDFKIYMNFW